ncbi:MULTISPECIES: response regulator [Streptomyces]|jgi:DNA-binding NarL/FixJ family response regulator|uniref:DNA-binding NarL/FixJ family response regulator n=2 Tax=Streptomyces TaxID=1883 RepID=A0A514JM63_9ACTN|nr:MULTISPECIES: response regulator transcription factor [Streptomyces]MBA8942577.1 DNA-binding NarL/FixJ family response regulator [Streptomyces calvus]MBA8975461.1 DNA-binding NarL/FixJ family response regulator [Streptomyces calvus]MYS26069.1 response regulator [Streptomyces sp. SID7804]QDI68411.1 DNA-binding response regulator [Streptomyces calvus]GGP68528.1 DNA-binding response regulator [Streptomyces calvus]
MTIRVFLVDDHPLFRAGVRLALEDVEDMEVVGEADSGEEAVQALVHERVRADVVLMDVQMPGSSGVSALPAITAAHHPGAEAPRVLMMSVTDDDDMVVAALRAGAHGYLLKGAPRTELIRAVRTVAGQGAVFSPTVAARLSGYFSAVHELPSRAAFPQLTERERQILDLIARGYTNRRIARELVLAEKTVRNHVSHVFAKLQVSDRATAVVRARDAGLGV